MIIVDDVKGKEDEEVHRLRQINVEEWSLVDNPAIEETWLILKRDNADNGAKEMNKMDELEKAKAKKDEDEETKKKRKKEEEEKEVEKASVKEAAAQAAKLLESATGGSEDDKKRIKMLVGNLKSLAGIKKADDEEEEDEKVKKVGRAVSKETAESISDVAKLLKEAVDMLEKIGKPKKDEECEYGYPKYGYPKTKKVDEREITEGLKKVFALHKQGLVEEDEISNLLAQFRSEEVYDNE